MDEAEARRLGSETMHLSVRPFDVTRALATSDLMISPCGHGSLVSAVLAGCPMLLVPQQPEQRLLAERAVALGMALIAGYRRGKKHDYAGAARRLLYEPEFSQNAAAVARRHADFDPERTTRVIADRVEAILSRRGDAAGKS
jgi:UDP:flavonoid glycosyltransferase YjiC (YdhE family)